MSKSCGKVSWNRQSPAIFIKLLFAIRFLFLFVSLSVKLYFANNCLFCIIGLHIASTLVTLRRWKNDLGFTETAAVRRQILCAVVAVRLLILYVGCSPLTNTVRTATICCYVNKQLIQAINGLRTVAIRTPILCGRT